ncbi:CBS domain-containing protein [Candidatus Pyrohabitans sp.]
MQEEHVDVKRKEKYTISQARDRGSLDFSSHISNKTGSVMSIATTEVVTVPPTMTIKGAAETMTKYRFRRLPVTDPGTRKLLGIIGSSDIIDLLGGNQKTRLISEKYGGNFLAAINEAVHEIMVTDVVALPMSASIDEALQEILRSRIGGVVIVDDENRVKGIVTERDFVHLLADKRTGKLVEEYMTRKVITTTPGTTLGDAAKIMVRNSFRRLPVVSQGFLEGLLTTRMIIEFIGRNHIFEKIVRNRFDEVLKTRVSEIMSKNVPTVKEGTDLGEVARIIEDTGVGTVCVVEDSRLLGIITERDLLRAMVS